MKTIQIKLDSFILGLFIWKVYWGLKTKELQRNPESSEEWGTLVTFLFIPVIFRYRD